MKAKEIRPGMMIAAEGGRFPVVAVNWVRVSVWTNSTDDGRHKDVVYVHYRVRPKVAHTLPLPSDADVDVCVGGGADGIG